MTNRIGLPGCVGWSILARLTLRPASNDSEEPGGPTAQGRLWLALACLALALTAIAFGRTLGDWFTGLDALALVGAAEVRRPDQLLDLLTTPLAGGRAGAWANFYRPTLSLVFAGLHGLFGWRPWGYHAFDLSLHAANAVLLGMLAATMARRLALAGSRRVGLLAALVLLVHPLAEEAVPVIARCGDLLVTLLLLATLLVLDRCAGQLTVGRRLPLGGFVALCALTMGAKESGVLVLVAAPLYLLLVRVDLERSLRLRAGRVVLLSCGTVAALFLAARAAVLGHALGGYHQLPLVLRLRWIGRVARTMPVDLIMPGWAWELRQLLPVGFGHALTGLWPHVAVILLLCLALAARALGGRALLELARKPQARYVGFALAMLMAHALLYVATATYERRYLYGTVPFLALALAATAARRIPGPLPRPGWLAAAARAVPGLGAAALCGLFLVQSPVVRRYQEWHSCGEAGRVLSEGSLAAWASLPDQARVYLLNLPMSVSIDRLRRDPFSLPELTSSRVLSHYSLQAWLEAHFSGRTLSLVQLGSLAYLEPPQDFRSQARVVDGWLVFRTPRAVLELEPLGEAAARVYASDGRNGDETGFRLAAPAPGWRAIAYLGRPLPRDSFVVVFDGQSPHFAPLAALAGPDAELSPGAVPAVQQSKAWELP